MVTLEYTSNLPLLSLNVWGTEHPTRRKILHKGQSSGLVETPDGLLSHSLPHTGNQGTLSVTSVLQVTNTTADMVV